MARIRSGQRIAIVGAGRLGAILAERLAGAGFQITEIIYRTGSTSQARAKRLARKLHATARKVEDAALDADIVWFCVPDSKIEQVAEEFASRAWKGKIAFHSSGVLTSDELAALRSCGASVASVHPLMTFVSGSSPSLDGVPFAVEGDVAAVREAGKVVNTLGGTALKIRKSNKIAYHAFATMICPLLVSLLATSEEVAGLAGMSAKEARRRMGPIILQTVKNYERLGPAAAFSGPIIRGDAKTIGFHLRALRKSPIAKQVYVALARAALRYLPSANRKGIERSLKA